MFYLPLKCVLVGFLIGLLFEKSSIHIIFCYSYNSLIRLALKKLYVKYLLSKMLGTKSISDFRIFLIVRYLHRPYWLTIPNTKIENWKVGRALESETLWSSVWCLKSLGFKKKVSDFRFSHWDYSTCTRWSLYIFSITGDILSKYLP